MSSVKLKASLSLFLSKYWKDRNVFRKWEIRVKIKVFAGTSYEYITSSKYLAGLQNIQHVKRETDSLFCSGLTGVKITLGSSVLPRRQWHLFTAVRRCKQKRMTISVKPSFCPPPPFYFTPLNRISFTARSNAALLKLLTRPRFHYTTTMPVIMCILAGKWHRTHHRTVPPVCLVLLGLKTVTH